MKRNICIRILYIVIIYSLSGCIYYSAEKNQNEFILYDTLYQDYYSGKGWTKHIDSVKIFSKEKAKMWLKHFRELELGEYSNTGKEDYPVVIISLSQAKRNILRKEK
jgi:hypothetical protein